MQIFESSHAIEQACETLPDQSLRKLFQERYQQLKSDDYEIHELVHFWVIESAECLTSTILTAGHGNCSQTAEDLLKLPLTPECKEEHPGWTELVFVLLDDGFGLEVFIPELLD